MALVDMLAPELCALKQFGAIRDLAAELVGILLLDEL